MTSEQLKELLGKVTQQKEKLGLIFPTKEVRDLNELAPSLARRVIAAEKLVEAANNLVGHDEWGTIHYTDNAMWKDGDLLKAAITAYREASK